ncbi:MAG: hypothetical protein B7Y02_13350 [Rhodobacterales bacterium 17-64-5]|nr:MAG: hypothetical protein B7Y02_13350 [Rhodobacterales bacterium 17-64-5]
MLTKPIAFGDTFASTAPFQPEIVPFANLPSVLPDLAEIELVISPLIGAGFDAFDLLHHLGRAGFHGRLRVMSKALADRALVLRELRVVADPLGIAVELQERR